MHVDSAARWLPAPAGAGPATRRLYQDDASILENEWHTADGSERILECMPLRGESAGVARLAKDPCERVTMRMGTRLRPDGGRPVRWVHPAGGGLRAVAGPDAFCLPTQGEVHGDSMTARVESAVTTGPQVPSVRTYRPSRPVRLFRNDVAKAADRS